MRGAGVVGWVLGAWLLGGPAGLMAQERTAAQDRALERSIAEAGSAEGLPPLQVVQESPQRLAVEIRLGPYRPAVAVSDLTGVPNPWEVTYGDPAKQFRVGWRVFGGGEIDYQFFRRFGTLGIGLSSGYTKLTGQKLVLETSQTPGELRSCVVQRDGRFQQYQNGNGALQDVTSDKCLSGDESIFNVVPLEILLVYRFDVLARRFRVPLIPYVKAGFGAYFWWEGSTGEFVSTRQRRPLGDGKYEALPLAEQQTLSGASTGLIVRPGLALDLGVIDRQAAKVLDRELGLNRVSLFGELGFTWINSFGAAGKVDLSNHTFASNLGYTMGLAFEF